MSETFIPTRRQPKFEQTCAGLQKIAASVGEGAKMPTMKELKQTLGVSLMTLDSALADLEGRGVIQRVRGSGIYVAPRLGARVVLLCDPVFFASSGYSAFWQMLLNFARQRAHSYGEQLDLHFVAQSLGSGDGGHNLSPALKEDVRNGRVQGIVTMGVPNNVLQWLDEHKMRSVAVFAEFPGYNVTFDAQALAGIGAQALVARGCQRIAFWRNVPRIAYAEDLTLRNSPANVRRAFEKTLQKHGLRLHRATRDGYIPQPEWANWGELQPQEQGFRWARAVFSEPRSSWPDGLFSADDTLTAGILNACVRLGVQPGRDFLLATHANQGSPTLMGREEDLILIEFDIGQLVGQVFATLEALMQGDTLPNPQIYLAPKLRDTFPDPPMPSP